MPDSIDETIDEQTFFRELERAKTPELLIESFRDDVEYFKSRQKKFEFKRIINGATVTYYLNPEKNKSDTIPLSTGYTFKKPEYMN